MIKDQVDLIIEQAKLLLDEDVSVERRVRVARKIMEHARAIKVVRMAEQTFEVILHTGPIQRYTREQVLAGPAALHIPKNYG